MPNPTTDDAIRSAWAHVCGTLKKAGVKPGEEQYRYVCRESEQRIADLVGADVEQVRRVFASL